MPSCFVKQKCFERKGEVVSYVNNPKVFYYRERVKATGSYRSEKIPEAETLNEALEKAYEIHARFRQIDAGLVDDSFTNRQKQKAARMEGVLIKASESSSDAQQQILITRQKRRKGVPVAQAIEEWINHEMGRADANRIAHKTVREKASTLRNTLLPFLQKNGVANTLHITNTTFRTFDQYSRAKTPLTLQKEIAKVKEWINNWLLPNNLLSEDVFLNHRSFPKVEISPDDLLANPAISPKDWKIINKAIREHVEGGKKNENFRAHYWRFLFWHFTLLMYGSGARPEELLKVKWKDIKFRDVGRRSETRLELMLSRMKGVGLENLSPEELNEVQEFNERFPDLGRLNESDLDIIGRVPDIWSDIKVTSAKTKSTRVIPCQRYPELKRLKEFQVYHCKQKHEWWGLPAGEPNTYIFGHPGAELRPHPYSNYSRCWEKIRKRVEHKLEGHFLSNHPYTIYSMRSSFIEDSLIDGKDMFMIAKIAGHDPAMLMKHYERIDVRKRTRELNRIKYGQKANPEKEVFI
jgi:integrase